MGTMGTWSGEIEAGPRGTLADVKVQPNGHHGRHRSGWRERVARQGEGWLVSTLEI